MGGVTLYGVDVWTAGLVFARVGAMLMLLPGFGEPAVPGRIRLALALLVSIVLAPTLAPHIPPAPPSAWAASGLTMGETMIGVMFGGAARLLASALGTA